MRKLNSPDIQGFVLRGYSFPLARFLFLEISQESGPEFVGRLVGQITSGERWDERPESTVNIAFTYKGLVKLQLPSAPLLSFPVEFVQGMKGRAEILGDKGKNSADHWDPLWKEEQVHAWLSVYARSEEGLERRCAELQDLMESTHGAVVIGSQDAGVLWIDGRYSNREHFGYANGLGNPDYLSVDYSKTTKGQTRGSKPGQGKLTPGGNWAPLATGELLLGYRDEEGELPPGPIPSVFAKNGTFMVYRKLHQNVATFRRYLEEHGRLYAGGKEKLASKFVGRWRDGTPVELSPDRPDQAVALDVRRVTNFTYQRDLGGERCPIGAHIRRANPRDAFGWNGWLVNRRRIVRRGLPYGSYTPEDQPVRDEDEHGMIFIALNASISRQFEFICQQWMDYGNDAKQGSDRDPLTGNHGGFGTFMIQGSEDPSNPPYLCAGLPNFVELRGGDYFFVPSITALKMIATGNVNPY
jgi:Dyp-type peroxidase family